MKKNSFIQGTIIASLAIIFVKILGALYVIPFYSIITEQGGALYSYAYNIYNLFLTISITGFPIAISKMVSEFNEKKMYKAKENTYKISKQIILIISVISFLIVFFFAKPIASIFIGNLEGGNSIDDVAFVIRIISFSLLVIPFLSITRGYLQGHKYIKESTNSQIIEQIIRIAIVLVGSYIAVKIFNQSITIGVSYALTGSFFGGLVTYLYLSKKIKSNKKNFQGYNKDEQEVSNKELIKKFFIYSIPSIIISITSSIYDTVDQILVLRGSTMLGYSAMDSEVIASIISTWGVKICMLITAIGTAISINTIPHMVKAFIKNDTKDMNKKFNQILLTGVTISLPMAIGVSLLSNPVYRLFYGESEYGAIILSAVVFAVVFANFSTILDTALIGINEYKIIYLNTLFGVGLNLALDLPLMFLFKKIGLFPVWGASASTMISYTIAIYIALKMLNKKYGFTYHKLFKSLGKLFISCLIMAIPLLILNKFINFNNYSNMINLLIMLGYAFIGASIFAVINYENGLLYEVFGKDYVDDILIKLHLKKGSVK